MCVAGVYLQIQSHNICMTCTSYRIVQFFDGAKNIDGFDAKLAIHQNFPFQYFPVAMILR